MTNEASTSNPSCIFDVGSHIIGPNIVTVKLSGKNKYNLWRLQMECLLKSQQMVGFIDGQSPSPAGDGKAKEGDMEAWIAGDSLVKGWILGSLSEEVATKAVNHVTHMQKKTDFTAKDLWDELQRSYETKLTTRQAESVIEVNPSEDAKSKEEPTEEKTRKEKKAEILEKEFETKSPTRQAESEIEVISESEDAKSKDNLSPEQKYLIKRELYKSVLKGHTDVVLRYLKKYDWLNPWDKITNDGNTMLHAAVGSSTKNYELLNKLLEMTPKKYTLIDLLNIDGSTLLHVAAIGGHTKAVDILVERKPELLLAKDKEGMVPLALSVSNMHTETSHCLYEHMKVHDQSDDSGQSDEDIKTSKCLLSKTNKNKNKSKRLLEHMNEEFDDFFMNESGKELVILAISCQDFRLAKMIIDHYPSPVLSGSDGVLTALGQNFPRDLKFWETRRGLKEEFDRMAAPYLEHLQWKLLVKAFYY